MDSETYGKRAGMTTKDVAHELDCSLPIAYNIVNREDFPKVRYGRKIIIPREAFERWLSEAAAIGLDLKEPVAGIGVGKCVPAGR